MKKALVCGIIVGCLLGMILVTFYAKNETQKAEYDLFIQGTEYFIDGNFESPYSIFDTIYEANHNWFNSDEVLNKKFDNIVNLRIMSYDRMLIDKAMDYMNINKNYKSALQLAFNIHDDTARNNMVDEIMKKISEDAINISEGGKYYGN